MFHDLYFEVKDVKPKAQPRIRATKSGHVYTPDSADAYKRKLASAAREALGDETFLIEGPLAMEIWFYFKRPKSHYEKNKWGGVLRERAPYFHTYKPDLDNLTKSVLDALKGIINDDKQVVRIEVCKEWAMFDQTGVFIEKIGGFRY